MATRRIGNYTKRSAGSAELGREPLVRFALPASIRVVDAAAQEIEVCATSEAVDTYGTVFSYAASRDAFTRWAGNVREMHNRAAVGRRVAVRFDDAQKKVYVRLRISKGAPDTWEKVCDGTLQGASIGAANVAWEQEIRRVAGAVRSVDVARRYDLMELSLVDNASNPDAQGVMFVRGAALDEAALDALAEDTVVEQQPARAAAAPAAPPPPPPPPPPTTTGQVSEGAGVVSTNPAADDVALAIATRAMAAGLSALANPVVLAAEVASGRAARLAALGAPAYVVPASVRTSEATTAGGVTAATVTPMGAAAASAAAAGDALGGVAPGFVPSEGSTGIGVDQPYDVDGDHDEDPSRYVTIESGPTAGAVMAPSPAGSVAHMVHSHLHTGRYDDPSDHRETSAHQHLDGTSHIHEQVMDHEHGGHDGFPQGHTHPHIHVPDHGHHYRVADGAPLDTRLVADQIALRTGKYVSEAAFRTVLGVAGCGLNSAQLRIAVALDRERLDQAAQSTRDLGPYSRDPNGPADAGTPAQADTAPTPAMSGDGDGVGNAGVSVITAQSLLDLANTMLARFGPAIATALGQVRALDRDGQPIPGADANGCVPTDSSSTGQLDVSTPADGWTGRLSAADVTRNITESITASVTAGVTRAVAGQFDELTQRLARIESQPQPGGPILRAADRSTPLSAAAGVGSSTDAQLAALGSLAGRIADPQAQVAVAAEMIRLQQEAGGWSAAQQVMPRAGSGPVRR